MYIQVSSGIRYRGCIFCLCGQAYYDTIKKNRSTDREGQPCITDTTFLMNIRKNAMSI